MSSFGIPSFGVHVNGWVRDPKHPECARPHSMWVAKRSLSKATYAGLLDQMVAGGQPSFMRFEDNVRKECEEEASLPPHVIDNVTPTGAVSYRYATAKGLSSKTLATELSRPRQCHRRAVPSREPDSSRSPRFENATVVTSAL